METITNTKTNTVTIPYNSLVVYEGGGYDGCFWEFNAFIKDKEGLYHNLYTTGTNGLRDTQLNDEYLSTHFTDNNLSYEFIDLDNEEEILEYTKRANASLVIEFGTKTNQIYNKLYNKTPMVIKCPMCLSIEPIYDENVIGIGLQHNGGISYTSKDVICMNCYSEHTCGYCGEFHEDINDMYLGEDGEHCIYCKPDEEEDEVKHIKIALVGLYWADVTNNVNIGNNADQLIEYVNKNRYIVLNYDCFARYEEFWNMTTEVLDMIKELEK